MTPNFPHLAQRLFNTPLAITPGKIEVIMAALADRMGLAKLMRPTGEIVMLPDYDMSGEAQASDAAPYQVVGGVALISVEGTLVQKLGSLHPYSGMTGYDGMRALLSMALEDKAVRAVVLMVDSPGGEVAGCFDLVDPVRERVQCRLCDRERYGSSLRSPYRRDRQRRRDLRPRGHEQGAWCRGGAGDVDQLWRAQG